MINEMFGLGVLPLVGVNSECFFAERVRVALAKLRKLYFGQSAQGGAALRVLCRHRQDRQCQYTNSRGH